MESAKKLVTKEEIQELKVWYLKFTAKPLGQNPTESQLLSYYFPQLWS